MVSQNVGQHPTGAHRHPLGSCVIILGDIGRTAIFIILTHKTDRAKPAHRRDHPLAIAIVGVGFRRAIQVPTGEAVQGVVAVGVRLAGKCVGDIGYVADGIIRITEVLKRSWGARRARLKKLQASCQQDKKMLKLLKCRNQKNYFNSSSDWNCVRC